MFFISLGLQLLFTVLSKAVCQASSVQIFLGTAFPFGLHWTRSLSGTTTTLDGPDPKKEGFHLLIFAAG